MSFLQCLSTLSLKQKKRKKGFQETQSLAVALHVGAKLHECRTRKKFTSKIKDASCSCVRAGMEEAIFKPTASF